jgi:hypothetical protein
MCGEGKTRTFECNNLCGHWGTVTRWPTGALVLLWCSYEARLFRGSMTGCLESASDSPRGSTWRQAGGLYEQIKTGKAS